MDYRDYIHRVETVKGYCCATRDQDALNAAILAMRKMQELEAAAVDIMAMCKQDGFVRGDIVTGRLREIIERDY